MVRRLLVQSSLCLTSSRYDVETNLLDGNQPVDVAVGAEGKERGTGKKPNEEGKKPNEKRRSVFKTVTRMLGELVMTTSVNWKKMST